MQAGYVFGRAVCVFVGEGIDNRKVLNATSSTQTLALLLVKQRAGGFIFLCELPEMQNVCMHAWLEMCAHRHGAEQLLGSALFQDPSLLVPASSFQRKAVNVRAVTGGAVNLVGRLLRHFRYDDGLVQCPVVAPGSCLHYRRQERLWIEETCMQSLRA